MKYVIMADGKGTRWNNHLGVPKHLIEINGETIIGRTVRLLNKLSPGCEVIITSHDERYEFEGARRYEPKNNVLEIDRFTAELIGPDVCFLYGDTFYTENSLNEIIQAKAEDVLFFGNKKSIVAIKVFDEYVFRKNVENVRDLYLKKEISKCVGWQVYQSLTGQPFDVPPQLAASFVVLDEKTTDINTPEEYKVI